MLRGTSLTCLLVEAGMPLAKARHIDKELDRLRLGSLSSDDLAGLLLDWSNMRTYLRVKLADEQIKKLQGFEDGPSLFTLIA